MAFVNITGASDDQLIGPPCKKMRIQINSGWTGTVVIEEGTTADATTVVGTITNPSTGYGFEYWDVGLGDNANSGVTGNNPYSPIKTNIYVTTTVSSGTCDITVNTAGNFR